MANEKRLIDANQLDDFRFNENGGEWRKIANAVIDGIQTYAPTVDAVEVVHGRWDREKSFAYASLFRCSSCGQTTLKTYNYCPNCGAKMDGDGNA